MFADNLGHLPNHKMPAFIRDDFYHMRRGVPLSELSLEDSLLLKSFEQSSGNTRSALLLLHGFTSSPAVFRLMQPCFAHYDAVICPALPGHATSIQDLSQVRFQDWLSCAESHATQVTQIFEHVDVIGFSLGGLLACHISHRIPLHHLYLLAPAFDLHHSKHALLALAKSLKRLGFDTLRNAAGDLCSNETTEIAYRKVPLQTIIELLTYINGYLPPLPTCKTDLFLGHHDHVIASQRVADRFHSSSNTTLHWLDAAHLIPLEKERESVIECIQRYNAE